MSAQVRNGEKVQEALTEYAKKGVPWSTIFHPGRRSVTCLVPDDVFEFLQQFAGECEMSVSAAATWILEQWIKADIDVVAFYDPEPEIKCKAMIKRKGIKERQQCTKVAHYDGYCRVHQP